MVTAPPRKQGPRGSRCWPQYRYPYSEKAGSCKVKITWHARTDVHTHTHTMHRHQPVRTYWQWGQSIWSLCRTALVTEVSPELCPSEKHWEPIQHQSINQGSAMTHLDHTIAELYWSHIERITVWEHMLQISDIIMSHGALRTQCGSDCLCYLLIFRKWHFVHCLGKTVSDMQSAK